MRIRTLTVVFVAASAALAAGLTERLQTERMTVLDVDEAAGRFQCAEHRRWTTVAKDSTPRCAPAISFASSGSAAIRRD